MSTHRMERALSIGDVSTLYDLAPSTLRWWEKLGVLAEPARTGGRRVYDEHALRRVGLAYLCCVVGRMPLAAAAVITSGVTDNHEWRRAVDEQIGRLDQQIAQLGRARTYLERLRRCTDDDPATHRPYLVDEILDYTPRGRMVQPTRNVTEPVGVSVTDQTSDDEMPTSRVVSCRHCRGPVHQPRRGRRREYCSQRCRQRAYRQRMGPALTAATSA
jgi:MerR family transcriptional regulator, copper efflux regulator